MSSNTHPQPVQQPFDPMCGKATSGAGGGIPPGGYEAVFTGAELLPASDPDPMTGKGGRQWSTVKFTWRLNEDRIATRETPRTTGSSPDSCRPSAGCSAATGS